MPDPTEPAKPLAVPLMFDITLVPPTFIGSNAPGAEAGGKMPPPFIVWPNPEMQFNHKFEFKHMQMKCIRNTIRLSQ